MRSRSTAQIGSGSRDPSADAMDQPQSRRYFTDLDGMRGVLAVTVMLFHLGLNGGIAAATRGYVTDGLWALCVDFFFVLSGFVLYFSLERTRPRLTSYFTKRLRRLAPAFLIGTCLTLSLVTPAPSIRLVVANLLMIQSLLGMPSIDFPAWSIPFELFLPALVLPVIAALGRSGPRAARSLAVALVCATAGCAVLLAYQIDLPAARAFFGLALGMVLGRVQQCSAPTTPRPAATLLLFASAILLMALSGRNSLLAALFAPVSAVCILLGTQTRTLLSRAPFQAIGRWSYSIYLLHVPVLLGVDTVLGRVDGHAERKAEVVVLVVVVTIAAAAAMYHFIERPLMKGTAARAQTAP